MLLARSVLSLSLLAFHSVAAFRRRVITNEPSGNEIVVSNIESDGRVSFSHAVSAGGNGLRGITPPGPDGLFAQGCIRASSASNILVTVNPGSNTVSLFAINPGSPTDIAMIGIPAPSGGEFPASVAINKAGTRVCVLNGGAEGGVNCFNVNKVLGLVPVPNSLRSLNLNETTPPTGPNGSASQVIFSEDETRLIVSVKGSPPVLGFLATWDIASDGSLSEAFTKTTSAPGGFQPFSLTVIPGKDALLSADPTVGFQIFDFSEGGDQASSTVFPINGQGANCWSSRSEKTGNYYLSDPIVAVISEVHVDSNLNASVVKQYHLDANSEILDNDVGTIGGKDFLFVTSPGTTSIQVLALNGPGRASHIQSFNFSSAAAGAHIQIDPDNLEGMAVFIKSL